MSKTCTCCRSSCQLQARPVFAGIHYRCRACVGVIAETSEATVMCKKVRSADRRRVTIRNIIKCLIKTNAAGIHDCLRGTSCHDNFT